MTLHRPQITQELFESETEHGDSFHSVTWFVVSKMCISKNKNVENIKMKQETRVWMPGDPILSSIELL